MFNGMSHEEYERHAKEFAALVEARLHVGEEEYGSLTFLRNNVYKMLYEELADICNYALFIYVKVRAMEGRVNEVRADSANVDAGRDPV